MTNDKRSAACLDDAAAEAFAAVLPIVDGLAHRCFRRRNATDRAEAAAEARAAAWQALVGLARRGRDPKSVLGAGHTPTEAAAVLGLSPGRVRQLRHELAKSWRSYHADRERPEPTARATRAS